jgi:serine/threonine protein kinase
MPSGPSRYQLLARLGQGGMAEVWKARLTGPGGFSRVVVIKRILPHLAADPSFVKMFMSEARLSARLSHANIVQVFEFGEENSEHFLAMEFVHGRDLASIIREHKPLGPLSPGFVSYVGHEVCRALAYAHTLTDEANRPLRLIHRDISPSNVIVGFDGGVKLLDFGIAKALSDSNEGTQTGTLKGKFGYMAPEQLEGQAFDHRADLFAVGVVLHELLTGRRLFKGGTDFQTIANVKSAKVDPPSSVNALVPLELDTIVLKALNRPREDRYQSAAELGEALESIVHHIHWNAENTAKMMAELFPDVTVNPDAHVSSQEAPTRAGRYSGETALRSHINVGRLVRERRWPIAVAVAVFAAIGTYALVRPESHPAVAAPAPVVVAAPQPVTVHVTSVPPAADVFVEGELRGRTPLDFTLERGFARQLRLVADGYEPALAEASGVADTQIQMVLVKIPVAVALKSVVHE